MLVLTQRTKEDEYIQVGESKIFLVKIKGQQARIGIEAPKDIKIQRYIKDEHGYYIKPDKDDYDKSEDI